MANSAVNIRQGMVVFAKNKARVSAFYQQTLALELVEQETSHDLLRGPGIELVIHATPRKYAAGIKIAKPPRVREDTSFKPSFFVPELEAVRAAATATGGSLKPAAAAWQIA